LTDPELNELLRKSPTPSRSDAYWSEFPSLVSCGIARAAPQSVFERKRFRFGFATAFATGLTVVCLLVGFWFGARRNQNAARLEDTAQARKLIAELTTLFPHQLEAIVIENGRTELRLSEKADVLESAAVLLRICGKTGCARVITFSGQQVRVNEQWCDVLVDSRGNVIVAGPRFVWSKARDASSGTQIDAKSLGDML